MFLNSGAGEVGDMEGVQLIITNTARVIPYIDRTATGTGFLRAQRKALFNLWGSGYI